MGLSAWEGGLIDGEIRYEVKYLNKLVNGCISLSDIISDKGDSQ